MPRIYTSVEELIGRTPLLELGRLSARLGLSARLLGKLESFNPAGSAKDRVAKSMLDDAEARGILKPGAVIIEPTSGNTGIGLCSVAAARGYQVVIVMPDGTITGVGQYLKARNPQIQIVAVEPAGSPVLAGGVAGSHKLQGIGAGFVPQVLDQAVYSQIIAVQDGDAYEMSRLLGRWEGLLAGISSGAALWAAAELAKRPENQGKTVVALLPDSGERYLSTGLYGET